MLHNSGRSRGGEKPRAHLRARPPPSPATASRRGVRTTKSTAQRSSNSTSPSQFETPVVSSVEETSFTFEFKQGCKKAKGARAKVYGGKEKPIEGLCKKAKVIPMKMPMVKENVKEVEFTHSSPSIVARLMGLDTMPRPNKGPEPSQSNNQNCMEQRSWGAVQGAHASCEEHHDELPELKDVFEVTEMENMAMHEALGVGNEMIHPEGNKADLDFIRQKFMEIKCLSGDKVLMNSKEFSEVLDILYSKKDLLLEFLQESNGMSGLSGHLHDYGVLQLPSFTSSNTVAKPFEDSNYYSSVVHSQREIERDGMVHLPKELEDSLPSLHIKENYVLPEKPLTPENERKCKASGRCSKIVVLKPNLQKGHSSAHVPSSEEKSQFERRRNAQPLANPRQSVYRKDMIQSMAPGNFEVLKPKGDAADASSQRVRKEARARGSRRKLSEAERYLTVGSQRVHIPSTSHDSNLAGLSSMSSAGSSVSQKGRKHLSERWQKTCQSDTDASIPTDSRTLGEMLELSDKDAAKVTSHKRASVLNLSRHNMREVPGCPLGISSKDGWKSGISNGDDSRDSNLRNFSRSKSLPASSTIATKIPCARQSAPTGDLPILKDILNAPSDESANGNIRRRSRGRKARHNNDRAMLRVGKENMLPEKAIHDSAKVRHSICISDLSRSRPVYNEHPGDATKDHQISDSAALHCQVDEQTSKLQKGLTDQKPTTSLPETKEDTSTHNQDKIMLKEERNQSAEFDIMEFDSQAIQTAHTASPENCECSSPTVSLQHHSGEEYAYSGLFKSVNDGIQGLRVQIKMLKMDQADTCGDDSDAFLSDEYTDRNITTYQMMEEMLPTFKDEEDRDYAYIQDMLGSACDFAIDPEDCQVGSNVFRELENKYSLLLLWSKSERKLLFDLVNSILADVNAPGSNLHSKMLMKRCWPNLDQEQVVENVWQMVLMQSYHSHCVLDAPHTLPLDHHSESEAIGKEIMEMIHDDILEESVAEFTSQENVTAASEFLRHLFLS